MKRMNGMCMCASLVAVVAAMITSTLYADMSYADNGGRTWSYTANDDGSIKITGVKMRSPSPITIPTFLNGRHVTRIGDDAFRDNAMITGVTIPGCIVGIGDRAFSGCANLEELTILEGVKAIGGSDAFRGCPKLKSVTLPKSLTFIRQRAFKNMPDETMRVNVDSIEHWLSIRFGTGGSNPLCNGKSYLYIQGVPVVDLRIPEGTEEIKGCAFCGCSPLKNILIPGSVKRIGSEAFAYMKGAKISFASTLGTVESAGRAFHDSSSDCLIEVSEKPGYVFDGWEDDRGNIVKDLLNQTQKMVVKPRWKLAARRKSYSQWHGDRSEALEENSADSERRDKPKNKSRRCWKCHGKGTVAVTARETCDICNGQGVITTKVTLTDRDTWYGGSVRKESVSRRSCGKCNRSGTISVKKEVECPQCHGTGER